MNNVALAGYENAPATKMLATHCAACARPLVDAESVQAGMGPDCRRKYGKPSQAGAPDVARVRVALDAAGCADLIVRDDAGDVDQHATANKLIYRVAAEQTGRVAVLCTIALWHLGYGAVAERFAERIGLVRVAAHPSQAGHYKLTAPYSEAFFFAMRAHGVYGTYDKATKSRVIPVKYRAELFRALKDAFPGFVLLSEKGPSYLASGDDPVGAAPRAKRDLPR